MQTYPSEKIRNALLFGHQGTGKTSLAEALLFTSGASTRLGKIEDGNTICDFESEEMKRSLSVSLALAPIEWKEHKINLLDAPGYADFVFEVEAALRVADLGILVVSAVEGVEVQHQIVWELAAKRSLPRMVFVNKLERERASYSRTLEDLTARFGSGFAPLHLPIGEEHEFGGIADILTERAYSYDPSGKPTEAELPDGVAEQAQPLRTQIIESVAESDDALLEKYLEGETLESKEIVNGLAKGLATGNVFPVLAGSATKLVGIDRLADFLVEAAPSPTDRGPAIGKKPGSEEEIERPPSVEEPTSAFVFKTVSDPYVGRISLFKVVSGKIRADSNLLNVSRGSEERLHQLFTLRGKNQENVPEVPAGDLGAVAKLTATASGDTLAEKSAPVLYPPLDPPERALARAIAPKTKGDEDKLMTGLARIQEEDQALQLERNTETHQTVLWGTGEAHLDVVLERLARKFGVGVQEIPLRIAYRETVKGTAQGIGRHVKQSGGHGQYGIAHVEVEPLERGAGLEFVDKIVGGVIPNQFIPSVHKGIERAMAEGTLAGYPVVDLQATLFDGKYHPVDSSDIAFQLAGALAFKDAAEKAGLTLLEPIYDLEVIVPESYLGEVMGDLNGKRGRIQGTESIGGGRHVIKVKVPQAEIVRYAIDLRSMTAGQGTFRMSFSHYEDVPAHLVDKIVAESKEEKES